MTGAAERSVWTLRYELAQTRSDGSTVLNSFIGCSLRFFSRPYSFMALSRGLWHLGYCSLGTPFLSLPPAVAWKKDWIIYETRSCQLTTLNIPDQIRKQRILHHRSKVPYANLFHSPTVHSLQSGRQRNQCQQQNPHRQSEDDTPEHKGYQRQQSSFWHIFKTVQDRSVRSLHFLVD